MAILRRDDTVTNGLGNAISGAKVYYLQQPADTTALSPLAPVYSDTIGTAAANPQITDGLGHAVAYLQNGQLYTVAVIYPNGARVIYADQSLGDASGGGSNYVPFAGTPLGEVDGTNTVFTLANGSTPLTQLPVQAMVWVNFPLGPNVGYFISIIGGVAKVTFAAAPQPASGGTAADFLYAQGLVSA